MRAPKDDSLINRNLFNNDLTRPFNTTKQAGYPASGIETQPDMGQEDNRQHQLETKKERDAKDIQKNAIQSHSNPNGTNEKFGYQPQLQEADLAQTNSLRIFFYLKELLTNWFTELSVRPTQTSTILTVTLYLIAILSTVQKRDGDRWLKSVLSTKLPGYTTLYQNTSWETFRHYTLKRLIEKHNPHSYSSFTQDAVKNLKEHNLNAQTFNKSGQIDETELHLGKQAGLFRNLACEIRASGIEETPVQDVETKNFQFLNSPLGRGDALGFQNKPFVDLYKDKALIYLRSPWEKEIRKDFVGFFVKRQLEATTQARNNTNQTDNHIVLPWYRIDACNKPDRVVLAAPKRQQHGTTEKEWEKSGVSTVDLKEQSSNGAVSHLNQEQCLRDRRAQSALYLRENPKRFNLTGTTFNKSYIVSPHCIKERISGLEYIFPFHTSKARVYAQNDSIPLKLESAYSSHNLFNSNSIESGVAKRTAFVPETAFFNSTTDTNQVNKAKNELFTKNNQLFFGKNFYSFQKRLRELFYWYGFLPPYNLIELNDQKQSQPQIDKQTSRNEIHRDNLKDNLNLDPTLGATGEEERIATNSLQKGELVNTVVKVKNFLHKNKIKNELSYDNLAQFNSIKQQVDNLIDRCADQSDSLTDPDQFTPLASTTSLLREQNAKRKASLLTLSTPGIADVSKTGVETSGVETSGVGTPASTMGDSIAIGEIESKGEELQQTLAQFAFKNWPLFANVNNFAQQGDVISNRFERNDVLLTRLMSGYKFPDCTKQEIDCLFREFVLPHLLVASCVTFSPSYLINQTVLRPLFIKLPPALPFCFFEKLALLLYPTSSGSTHTRSQQLRAVRSLHVTSDREQNFESLGVSDMALKQKPKPSNINIEYKRISLQELAEVKNVFVKLGKDYEDYLSLPKDSACAIRISPSLEDDKAFKLKTEQKEKRDEERVTAFERLQKTREREERLELGKKLRPFAYKNQFASQRTTASKMPFLKNSASENRTTSEISGKNSYIFPIRGIETPAFCKQDNLWIDLRLGRQNLLSDRKYSFFGRKHLLTKRLVAQEQKEIDEQISKGNYRAPGISLLGEGGETHLNTLFANSSLIGKGDLDELTEKHAGQLFSHKKLQKRARKGLIKLLGSPDLSAHHVKGSLNRTRKANRALRGKVIKSAYSHLRWQKKRFRSRMLGTPCERHLVMPEISSTDWRKLLEWQLKNYFFLEEKRLQPLIKQDPEKNFKIRQLHVYLPWVTIRTPSNKPFQWPYTRLDCADCIVPTQISNQFYTLPEYKPVYYWDSGRSVSMSLPAYKLSRGLAQHSNTIRTRAVEEPYLCEPLTNQSWLLIYRLFLAFALQHVLKYIYRVSLKGFLIEMANSDFGLMVTSPKFREWLEHARPKSFYTPRKRLRDVAAIEESIPILSEIVWYLRNLGRGRTASRGFLLVGPTGSDKTSVVQAIAGECKVAVVVQSISALAMTNEDPYEQLENAFALARQKAPCVLFLDDLDLVGQSRAGVIKNDIGPADLLFSLDTYTAEGKLCLANLSNSLHTHLLRNGGNRDGKRYMDWQFNSLATNPAAQTNIELELKLEQKQGSSRSGGRSLAAAQQNQESQTRRLNLLLRLLTEMDGVSPLNGVVVLATSEQPALLDPALLRAGRFERRIHLSLPNRERRIQLFKAGTKKIGRMQSIPWDYLGTRTTDMSAANIASAINHSAIKAILDNTVHTVESLEHGLNCVNGLPNRGLTMPVLQQSDPFHYSRLAFYQAGKAVVHNLLPDHPELGFCSLDDAVRNQTSTGDITRESVQVLVSDEISPTTVSEGNRYRSRSPLKKGCTSLSIAGKGPLNGHLSQKRKQDNFVQYKLNSNVQSARTRIQFETRLVGLYAGKAAELLHLSSNVVSHCTNQPEANGNKFKRYSHSVSTPITSNLNSGFSRPGRLNPTSLIAEERSNVASTFKLSREEPTFFESPLQLSVKRLANLSPSTSNSVRDTIPQVGVKRQDNQNSDREQVLDSGVVKPNLVSWHLKSSKTSGWLWQSNLGLCELLTASSLIHLMVDRWYLYSQKVFTYKTNKVTPSLNHEQIRNETLFPLAKRLSQELNSDLIKPNFWGLTSYTSQKALPMQAHTQQKSTDELYLNKQIYQERIQTDWWQAKICQALEMRERPYGKWYRIYLPKIEEREQNKEWVPPDTVFHQSLTLANLTTKKFKQENKRSSGKLSPSNRFDRVVRGIPRTRFGESRPVEAVAPKRRAFGEKSLTQPHLSQTPSWLGQRSTGSNAREITWKVDLNQITSSKKPRSLRFLRLHLNPFKQSIPSLKTLNDLYLFERDSAHQKAVIECFYTAFSMLNDNRELLDCFADHLIRYKILRSHEISKMCSLFAPDVSISQVR